jgi:hypothetical protein
MNRRIIVVLSFVSVGQSFGFASGLPPGPELALLPMKHREFPAKRVGRNADGWAEAPALRVALKNTRYWAVSRANPASLDLHHLFERR